MVNFFNILIDFIFPPRDEEVALRSISKEDFLNKSPKSDKPEFPFINSIFSYKDPMVRELIWQIKYKKSKHAIRCAGFALYTDLLKSSQDNNIQEMTLVPVPISNKRRKERGYNQCELIIDEIIRFDNNNQFKADFDLIRRTKNTDKQTFMKRNERLKNTKNIFEVTNNNLDRNTKIIIIDDVTTTGSTLREIYELLLSAGHSNVEAFTVAH